MTQQTNLITSLPGQAALLAPAGSSKSSSVAYIYGNGIQFNPSFREAKGIFHDAMVYVIPVQISILTTKHLLGPAFNQYAIQVWFFNVPYCIYWMIIHPAKQRLDENGNGFKIVTRVGDAWILLSVLSLLSMFLPPEFFWVPLMSWTLVLVVQAWPLYCHCRGINIINIWVCLGIEKIRAKFGSGGSNNVPNGSSQKPGQDV